MSPRTAEHPALIVIDMLNPYEHEDADALTESVKTILEPVSSLVTRACDIVVNALAARLTREQAGGRSTRCHGSYGVARRAAEERR